MTPEDMLAQGWEPLALRTFSATVAPVFMRGTPGSREVAMLTGSALANHRADTVHGGALMTFADIALGMGAVDATGAANCATVQLNFHFVRAVGLGQCVTCLPEVVRRTSRLIFLRGLFMADGEVAGSADGIYQSFPGPGVTAN